MMHLVMNIASRTTQERIDVSPSADPAESVLAAGFDAAPVAGHYPDAQPFRALLRGLELSSNASLNLEALEPTDARTSDETLHVTPAPWFADAAVPPSEAAPEHVAVLDDTSTALFAAQANLTSMPAAPSVAAALTYELAAPTLATESKHVAESVSADTAVAREPTAPTFGRGSIQVSVGHTPIALSITSVSIGTASPTQQIGLSPTGLPTLTVSSATELGSAQLEGRFDHLSAQLGSQSVSHAAATLAVATGEPARTSMTDANANVPRQPLETLLGERLQVQIARRSDRAVVRLDPPSMGTIEILIRQEGSHLHVQLRASN